MLLRPLSPRWSWPAPRSQNPARVLVRMIWGAPTNLLGHTAGRLVGRGKPIVIEGPAARGTLYRLPAFAKPIGAIALGSAILFHPNLVHGEKARAIVAHELAHTRQHDWLGPTYLPLHALCQVVSALLSIVRTEGSFTIVHDFNPLEQTFIALGVSHIETLDRGNLLPEAETEEFYSLFGLDESAWPELSRAIDDRS